MENFEFEPVPTDSTHPVLGNLRRQIELLEEYNKKLTNDNAVIRNDRDRVIQNYANDVENTRAILIEAIVDGTDVRTLANSIADVFAISLLKSITVSMVMNVEATMVVPADYEISNLEIGDVQVHCYNSDVEDFSVESFDIIDIEEAMYT
jgi:hypothetical protein